MVRLGTTEDLERQIKEAQEAGAFVERTTETVRAILSPDEQLFSALKKGDSDVWVINYNDKYYGDEQDA
jgi:hypothetical protein